MLITKKSFLFELFYGVATAILFSSFIYLEHYGITVKLVNSITAITALAMMLYAPKRAVLVAGFFIGLFWFYWIGYSFKYNGIENMETIISIAFALVYMLFFGILALTKSPLLRAGILFGLTFVAPVDFNWMQMEILFVDSYFGVFKYQFALILLSLSLVAYAPQKLKYAPLLLLIFAINYGYEPQKDAPLSIKLVETNIPQDMKWREAFLPQSVALIDSEIDKAIEQKYDVIIFPESVFAFFLAKEPFLMEILKQKSQKIAIVAGSLLLEDGLHYNVTYLFDASRVSVAKKMVLVPFGEYIPLPSFLKESVNELFFAGASDFKTASKPTDFLIKGVRFRNAICYEATRDELFRGEFDFMIASSNNAWFYPSIEPTIQKLLMRYYARKNGVTIYHSANWRGTAVIK